MNKLVSYCLTFCLFFVACACDKEKVYDKTKAVDAFAVIDPIRIDESLSSVAIKIPNQKNNSFWIASGSSQNQLVENIEKKFLTNKKGEIVLKSKSQYWFFYSGKIDDHFVFFPLIKDDKIFILDTSGELVSSSLKEKKTIWKSQVFAKHFLKNYQIPRISYANGKIFAIAGINKIAAISEANGNIIWEKDISSIPISVPISDGKMLYVSTNDNKLYALNESDGSLQWVHSGITRQTAILGAADPILYGDSVLVSYSSGEIYMVKKKNGEVVWSQDLNINKAVSSDFYLNDIDATPVVKDGVIYVIGNGGLMMAINVKDGNYFWKKQIAGTVDFWAAGDFLFVINNENKLIALSKKNGAIKWISQLPDLEKPKKPQTKIIYSGVVMAGDKLIISRADGQLIISSPLDGKIEKTFSIGKKISHAPVVVNGKIYLHAIGKYLIDLIEVE
jgi:outer membrane protein assembly factor BamB